MNYFILVLALIPSIAFAAPKAKLTATPTPPPKGPVEKAGMVCRSKQQDLELRDWIGGLINQVHQAQASNSSALASNGKLQGELQQSKLAATELANQCAEDKKCADAPLSCWFHRLLKHILWIGGALVVILIAVTIFAPGALKLITSVAQFAWNWIVALFSPKPKV